MVTAIGMDLSKRRWLFRRFPEILDTVSRESMGGFWRATDCDRPARNYKCSILTGVFERMPTEVEKVVHDIV